MTDENCCGACGYPIHATKDKACGWCRQTADRIEALTKELEETQDRANAFATKEYYTEIRAERAEAKLAKAVEALELIDHYGDIEGVTVLARATLAEIKGDKP